MPFISKENIRRALLHANALFSDTAGKIRLALMSLPNHSKGFYSP